MTPRGGRRKSRDRTESRALASEAREMLAAAIREQQHSARSAAILGQNAAVRASDALCTHALGYHSQGEDHAEALATLRLVRDGAALASMLQTVLRDRSEIGYDIQRVKDDRLRRILRNAGELVEEAVRRSRE
jgi:hypothetical protein